MFTRSLLILLAMPLLLSSAEPLTFPSTPPTEARDAAKTFRVLDGFEMQLIAGEPLVTDPVAITYDEDGRAYVCEMNDYPYTDKATHKPSQENPTDADIGKVRLLTDTDGDGVFDKASVFAEGLSWPTGAACWKGGIFVTATPDVWYLKDTDGDGVADVRKKVFTGLKKLNVQAVMNNPIWGLDHRIYIAGGTNGGEIRRAEGSEDVIPLPKDAKPLPIKRNDFSFDPSTGDVRLESGGARFGNTFDDWGNRFLCNIRNPCQHVVIPHRYLERNPYVSIASPLNDCAEAGDQLPVYRTSPVEPWRDFRAQRWSSEGSHLPKSELVGAGVVTSSAGITVYRGDAYPKEYRDFAFVADVAGNLFYRMKLVPDGVTFKAVQVDGTKNFCTSDDVWFRPVNFTNAPDGCLHVCDMYREVIEHPWSIPDDIHAGINLLNGRDRGRIWRLRPSRFDFKSPPKLSQKSSEELVELLEHKNAWHRETAHRLIWERQDHSVKAALWQKSDWLSPLARLHASSLLSGMNLLTTENMIERLQREQEPQIKAQLLRMFGTAFSDALNPPKERRREEPMTWEKLQTGFKLVREYQIAGREHNPLVRFEATLVAGPYCGGFGVEWHPIPTDLVLPWQSQSFLLGNVSFASESTRSVFDLADSAAASAFVKQAMQFLVSAGGDVYAVTAQLAYAKDYWSSHPLVCHTMISALQEALSRKGSNLVSYLEEVDLDSAPPRRGEVLVWLLEIAKNAAESIKGTSKSVGERIRAMPLASIRSFADNQTVFESSLSSSNPAELQLAALDALNTYREPAVAEIIVGAWKTFTPALRDKAQLVLLSRTDRIPFLLAALESGTIAKTQVSAASRATLGRNKNAEIAARVAKLFGDSANPNRKAVIDKYLAALTTRGDTDRGAKVYEMACMACHKYGTRGIDIGPHLATVKAWTPEQLLTNILDPNREVSPNFALYVIETKDGRTLSGLVMSETAGNVVLKRVDGGQESLLRSDIQSISSTGTSLMPEGVEAAITPEQMADLIEFLRQ